MMNCIIIDDEPLAIEVLKSYCEAISSLELLGVFSNAMEALDFLITNRKIDLIFCDIEMPNITGVDFIKSLQGNIPFVIFTTAYPQYALEGYELNVTDYLIKPIPFPRFVKSINRVNKLINSREVKVSNNMSSADGQTAEKDSFIFVKSEYENVKLFLSDIIYIQGLKDYLKIYVKNSSPILTLMNFKGMQSKLGKSNFLRVHRSYIVNIHMINSIQRNKIIIGKDRIPIGESYKEMVYERFGI